MLRHWTLVSKKTSSLRWFYGRFAFKIPLFYHKFPGQADKTISVFVFTVLFFSSYLTFSFIVLRCGKPKLFIVIVVEITIESFFLSIGMEFKLNSIGFMKTPLCIPFSVSRAIYISSNRLFESYIIFAE